MKSVFKKIGGAVVLAASSVPAFAAGPDMATLTDQIDFGTVTVAVLAIAGLLATVYVAMKGAKLVLSMLKSS